MKENRKDGNGEDVSISNNSTKLARRHFLAKGAVMAGGVLTVGGAGAQNNNNLPPNVPQWMKHEGMPLSSNPYGQPSDFEKHVIRQGRGDQVMAGAGSLQSPLQ